MAQQTKAEPPAQPPVLRAGVNYWTDKEFSRGPLKLVLRFSADEMRQRDVDQLMASLRRSTLGETSVEHAHKVLRAAVECGWVVEPVFKIDKDTDAVAELRPSHTLWYTAQIDAVYAECVTHPLA